MNINGAGGFKKGESGNPGGRQKNALREFLRGKPELPDNIYDAVHPLLSSKRESTKIWAAEFLRDSTWGKPMQAHELQDGDGNPVSFEVINYSPQIQKVA